MASYGERFSEFVRDHLVKNNLPSLGRLNGKALAALADQFEQSEIRKDKKERAKRLSKVERDALFEALARETGCNLQAMTEPEVKKCFVAVSAIIRATPDVTPEEIKASCKRYHREMAGATITPHAIANNWSKLFDRDSRKAGVSSKDWALEPKFDWRRVCSIRFNRDDPKYRDRRAWEEESWDWVPPNVKQTIWAEGEEILSRL